MSGLQNFLTPYSHLIFANRDKVIVVLALVLGWTVIQLLVARWRTERLERDLTAVRANQSTSPARPRHLPAQLADDPAEGAGMLPPVKGGRSYARNLGTALQKAGVPAAGPQIYSPPVPAGWNPNTGNNQSNPVQAPMQPPTYAPQPAPWGGQPGQPPAPWGYPAGANRAPFGAQPNGPAPGPYAPQMPPAPAQNPGQPYQPSFPQAGSAPFQQPFAAPSTPNDFTRPNADSPPANAAFASVAPPPAPPVPAPPAQAQPGAPTEEPDSKDAGRRGKPKRRRFNLSVLDSLEKMVQSKPAEAPAPPAQPAAEASFAVPAPVVPPPAPVVAPTLFEQPSVAEEANESSAAADQPEAVSTPEAQAVDAEPIVEQGPESQPELRVEEWRPGRPDMRSMLFGEEPEPVVAPSAKVAESTPAESAPVEEVAPVTVEADATSPVEEPSSWSKPEPVAETAPVEEATTDEPVETPVETPVAEVAELPETETVEAATQAEPDASRQESAEPTSFEASDAPAGTDPESTASNGDAGVLVIIEDDQAAAEYYATLFRGNGYKVEVANDGVSGVDLCVKVQPQVILLDVMMPRQNGILVLQTLRASDETRNTPVVVMSNFSEPTLIKRALQLGALEYVIKTQVEGAALLDAVPRWMNREKAFAA